MSTSGTGSSNNGLICFTNCLLPQEDGSLVRRDLWIDERRGVILDAQRTFFVRKERPDTIIDLDGNILSPGLIDIQINGAYDFDFSVYDGDDDKYRAGLEMVATRIVETGVTSLLPTVITQDRTLYPHLLSLLHPFSPRDAATLLGWHAEGPFLQGVKRGAHAQPFLLSAPDGFATIEQVYGDRNVAEQEDWEMHSSGEGRTSGVNGGVRMVTAAPEVEGIMQAIGELASRGIFVSIGHSTASSNIASQAVRQGARLITHLFNAMPQLHHRDPGIIGLLGASPGSLAPAEVRTGNREQEAAASSSIGAASGAPPNSSYSPRRFESFTGEAPVQTPIEGTGGAEALYELRTPPDTPMFKPSHSRAQSLLVPKLSLDSVKDHGPKMTTTKKANVAPSETETGRPFYGIIVDGVHSHPNSVHLAYSAHRDGCILITDAMKVLNPHMRDGIHDWRDGKRVVKEGVRLFIEGTDTLAGSVVTLDTCVRNFARFTGCSLGDAIKCATYNPARCLNIDDKKGTLRPGADADLVIFDRRGYVLSTWIAGRKVWTKDGQ